MTPLSGARTAPVRVGLVVGQLGLGGAERQLFYLATGLDRGRFEPTVFCLSEQVAPYGARLEEAGVEVVPFPRRGHFDVTRVVQLGREVRRRGTRLLHAFLLDASAYAVLAAPLCGSPPVLASNRVCLSERNPLRRAFDRWALGRSDAIIVNSEEVLRFTSEQYGVPASRMRRIYNGLDPRPFAAAAGDRSARASLGAEADDLLVVTVGRIEPQKNPALFADVAERVVAREPRARFAWVGTGNGAVALETTLAGRGLGGRVRLVGSRANMPAVLGAADLHLSTSDAEGLPNVVLEAMAAALPTVATDLGGTREALGETGRLCPPGNAGALADAVLALLGDRGEREDLGCRAQERVRREFPLERMIRETESTYDECLHRRGIPEPGAAR